MSDNIEKEKEGMSSFSKLFMVCSELTGQTLKEACQPYLDEFMRMSIISQEPVKQTPAREFFMR